ncbi:hypothetical protein ACL02U_12015 [Streptomyces sp. MS06]|uniref:hypothetical protein n=1 Tax=Streptomyces sp. MS06 TaxID=3385974 RepID=UPI0039A14F4C
MHHQPNTTADDYQWPTCAACGNDLWADELDRQACRPCEDKTARRLAELPNLYRKLDTLANLTRGSKRTSASNSGTRTPSIPPRLDALNLISSGGITTRLQAIEDSWRSALGWSIEPRHDDIRVFAPWRSNPAADIHAHVRFIANNLLWACSSYESIGQDIEEIRKLHITCKNTLEGKPKTGRIKIGLCPSVIEGNRCGQQLTASASSSRTRCPACGEAWEGEHEWRQLRAMQQRAAAEAEERNSDSQAA